MEYFWTGQEKILRNRNLVIPIPWSPRAVMNRLSATQSWFSMEMSQESLGKTSHD